MFRILMPVDGNEQRAKKQAEFVASLPDAAGSVEVVILFVFHGELEDVPEDLSQIASIDRIASVRRATEHLDECGVEYTLLDSSGDTADDIIAEAEREDVDLIVVGGRKRSPAGKILFGSVTQSVVLNSTRPVTVTGGTES